MAKDFKITITGLKETRRLLDGVGQPGGRQVFRKSFRDFGLRIAQISKERYLRGPRPKRLGVGRGRLVNSITTFQPQVLRVDVGPSDNIIYGRIHELGGIIRAKGSGFLVFKGAGGQFVSVRSVSIPKRPYLKPAARDALPDFPEIFAANLEKELIKRLTV